MQEYYSRHGPGYHHLALCVDDIDATLVDLKKRGFLPLGAPIETAPGLREVFLDPATAGDMMIQLVERRSPGAEPYHVEGDAVGQLAGQVFGKP